MYHTAFANKYDTSSLFSSTHSKHNCSEIRGEGGGGRGCIILLLLISMIHLSISPPLIPNTTVLEWRREEDDVSYCF